MLSRLLLKIFPVEIGDKYVLSDQDPWHTNFITIMDTKEGWVRYSFSYGGSSGLKYLTFLFIYRKKA